MVIFGTPTRFGTPASQLKAFIDTTGPLWQKGQLAGKVYTAFTASQAASSCRPATPIRSNSPPATPYGTAHVSGSGPVDDVAKEAARYQARRVVEVAAALKAGRAA